MDKPVGLCIPARRGAAVAPLVAALVGLAATQPVHAQSTHAQSTHGQILVVTEPAGVAVSIDGRAVGASPVTVTELVPGAHLVVATTPEGGRAQQIVEVEAARSTLVQLTIAPPATSAPPPPSTPPPTAPPPTAPPPSTPPPTAAEEPASVGEITAVAPASRAGDELPPSDLDATSEPRAAASEQVEGTMIQATGFPGLIGPSLGVHLDVPVYFERPARAVRGPIGDIEIDQGGPVAVARLTIEYAFSPVVSLVGAVDFNNTAFGLGAALHLPGWIPLSRGVAMALQPRLQALVYYSTAGGVFLGAEAALRWGFSPIPNLVVAAEIGAAVTGVFAFDGSALIEGVYAGPLFGGGVQWAFY